MPAAEAGLAVRALRARAGGFQLGPVDLHVAPGRVLALLGPSGSGKTTLLNAIAGLRPVAGGAVCLGNDDLTTAPPEQRRIGMVFQHGALFPHLTVAGNVAFGPRARGEPDAAREAMLLRRLGLEHLAGRSPRSLSGGEAQRVALARALAIAPRLLLLDEPLSALDAPGREELRAVLQDMLSDLAIPVVYVTHARDEALSLGDDIAVIARGRVRRAGPAAEVSASPDDPVAARLLGWRDLGRGDVRGGAVRIGSLVLPLPGPLPAVPPDGAADVFYRPEEVLLDPPDPAGPAATVAEVAPTAPLARVSLAGAPPVTALLLRRDVARLGLAPGAKVRMSFPPAALHVIPAGESAAR